MTVSLMVTGWIPLHVLSEETTRRKGGDTSPSQVISEYLSK